MKYKFEISVRTLRRGDTEDKVCRCLENCISLGDLEETFDYYRQMVEDLNDDDTLAEAQVTITDIAHNEKTLYYINQLGTIERMDEYGNLYDNSDKRIGAIDIVGWNSGIRQ